MTGIVAEISGAADAHRLIRAQPAAAFIIWAMTTAFKTIALIGKYKSPEIADPLLRLSSFLTARGVHVVVDPVTAAHVPDSGLEVLPLDETGKQADLAIVVGGDGTMLNIARTLAPY